MTIGVVHLLTASWGIVVPGDCQLAYSVLVLAHTITVKYWSDRQINSSYIIYFAMYEMDFYIISIELIIKKD